MSERVKMVFAGLAILLYILPLLLLGQNSSIMIWDNLDSNVVWFKVLTSSGQIFGPNNAVIPEFMNGMIPRMFFGSEFSLSLWLYYWFQPFTAYCINEIFMHLFAFISMYIFLNRHILKDQEDNIVLWGTSVAFSLLPFWPSGALTIAGQPLILYAFLNIRQGKFSKKEWIILLLIPLCSYFVGSVFLLFLMSLLWILDLVKTKRPNYQFGGAIVLITVIYLAVEYRLVMGMLMNSGFISHRLEFSRDGITALKSVRIVMEDLVRSQPHTKVLQWPVMIGTVLWGIILLKKYELRQSLLLKLLVFITVVAVFHGFWQWSSILHLKEKISLLRIFQFDRFYIFNPFAWYVSWALALSVILKNKSSRRRMIVRVLIALQIVLLFSANLSFTNMIKGAVHLGVREPSYKEFYAEKLFAEIKIFIGRNSSSYKVVSIGMHPSVAQYNGFHTLDGYMVIYPLEYKHSFRNIIAKELNKNQDIQKYFDGWGSRCYVFSSELGKEKIVVDKSQNITLKNFEINSYALKELGGEYVISAIKIEDSEKTGLKFLKLFEHPDSLYKIYLYQVHPITPSTAE